MTYEKKCYKFFHTLQYFGTSGGPLHQSSPIWVMTYSKAPSIKLANFVQFWKSL